MARYKKARLVKTNKTETENQANSAVVKMLKLPSSISACGQKIDFRNPPAKARIIESIKSIPRVDREGVSIKTAVETICYAIDSVCSYLNDVCLPFSFRARWRC